MKKIKKIMVCLLVISSLIGLNAQFAMACTKTPGCTTTGTRTVCGYVTGNPSGYHQVVEPNGYTTYCTVTVVAGTHESRCSGCNELLSTFYATCSEYHSHSKCYDRYNICK